MPEASGRRRAPHRIAWFDLGAGLLFLAIGLLLLGRGLWHLALHHELLLKTFASSALFSAVGMLFAFQGLKPNRPSRGKSRGRISKRHRSVKLWLLLFAFVSMTSRAQVASGERANGSNATERSTACIGIPMSKQKLAVWKTRAQRSFRRARSWESNSLNRERKLGERLGREIDRNVQFTSDSETQKYLSGLVQRLAINADTGIPFVVKIIETDDANIFSLPGGFLYVTTGLIRSTQSEAQLAGLLGHEVAHVLARHGSRQRKKQSIMNWASMPLIFVGPVGSLVRQVAGTTMPAKFSRDAEIEADVIGIDLIFAAGYDPAEYVNWLTSAVSCDSDAPSKFALLFDSYPVFQERLSLIESRVADLPRRSELIVSTSEFEDIRTKWGDADALYLRHGADRPILKRR